MKVLFRKKPHRTLPDLVVDISGGDPDKLEERLKAVKKISKKTKQIIHVLCFESDLPKVKKSLSAIKNILIKSFCSYRAMFRYFNQLDRSCTFVSAGDTRQIVISSCAIVGKTHQNHWPVLVGTFPTAKGLIAYGDIGAIAKETLDESEAVWIGLILKKFIEISGYFKNKSKLIGMQNIGEEEGKGGKQKEKNRKAMADYFKDDFYGNIEIHQINRGVISGLVANAVEANNTIKAFAGTQNAMYMKTKQGILYPVSTIAFKVLYVFCWQQLDWRRYSGAYLLGVEKPVIVTHGRSDEMAFYHALKRALEPETITIYKYINNNREIIFFK